MGRLKGANQDVVKLAIEKGSLVVAIPVENGEYWEDDNVNSTLGVARNSNLKELVTLFVIIFKA